MSNEVSKETYYSVKRDLLQCQKRPTTVPKETCKLSDEQRNSICAHPRLRRMLSLMSGLRDADFFFENKKNVIAVFTRKVAQDAELDVLTERRGKVSKET